MLKDASPEVLDISPKGIGSWEAPKPFRLKKQSNGLLLIHFPNWYLKKTIIKRIEPIIRFLLLSTK